MTDPIVALQGAIVARLNGDAALVALLGGQKVREHVPPGTAAPWIAFDEMRSRDYGTSSGPAHEHRLALVCVSRQPGTNEVLAIAERVAALLDGPTLTLVGHRLVNLTVLSTEILRAGREPLRKARLSLRAVTEPV